jgi:hypothetical protein
MAYKVQLAFHHSNILLNPYTPELKSSQQPQNMGV